MGMPDDYTYVRFASMEDAYLQLQKIITDLDKATDTLYQDIKRELGASWEGQAEQFFDTKRAQWNEREKEMGRQLFEAAQAVNIAKGNYESAEKRNISIWSD
ncbi:WXG100 family type VII secretion target [Nonomuraea sp. CA-218870]|uniref:WXG100 family type VII secretion target n=1 Tax=Nonomuraea corallina TaxID=2989783 RepID=A0ABT4SIY2_9ACTN|nr:WXG100 family type VII secretion target [Nonomuraea corallina]MDA0637162.1 WXG100 family type VII secretion target [Nonomuraea corallina]